MSSKYFEKLKDPRWQKKRLEILERDEWTCTVCGRSDLTLHVHHGYYEWRLDPWEYDNETLHTVCIECHEDADDTRRDIQFEMAKLPIGIQAELKNLLDQLKQVSRANPSHVSELLICFGVQAFFYWHYRSHDEFAAAINSVLQVVCTREIFEQND